MITDTSKNKSKVLAQSDFLNKSLSIVLDGRKQAYKMKIIYEFLDPNDPCPLYSLVVALKPLTDLVKENLVCKKNVLPGEYYKITGPMYKHEKNYAFSSEFLTQLQDLGSSYFDMTIEFEHSDFNFNTEYKTDFLTTQIDLIAYF